MDKLLNKSSRDYDRAEALAWFHAFASPIIGAVVGLIIGGSLATFIVGLSVTMLILIVANLIRYITSSEAFDLEKSKMYFNYTIDFLKIVVILITFAVIVITGVYHVS